MNERDKRNDDTSLREALRDWDPAARLGEPSAETVEARQAHLRRAALAHQLESERSTLALPMRWAAAAALALVAALTLMRSSEPTPELAPKVASAESVQMHLTASNGTRIFWSVELANGTGD